MTGKYEYNKKYSHSVHLAAVPCQICDGRRRREKNNLLFFPPTTCTTAVVAIGRVGMTGEYYMGGVPVSGSQS